MDNSISLQVKFVQNFRFQSNWIQACLFYMVKRNTFKKTSVTGGYNKAPYCQFYKLNPSNDKVEHYYFRSQKNFIAIQEFGPDEHLVPCPASNKTWVDVHCQYAGIECY